MRKTIMTMILLFSVSVVAEMPKYLKGATVTVTLKNGQKHTFKSEEYAVVKRENMQLPVVAKIAKALQQEKIVPNKKNRVYLLGGYGSTGDLKSSTNGEIYEVKHKKGVVGGLGYQHKLNQKLNVGVQVQTNGTSSLSIGTDF